MPIDRLSGAAGDPQPIRFIALDSLRGIAACFVLLYHLHTVPYAQGFITGNALSRNGWLFVEFFFVLSGFVICAAYAQRLSRGFSIYHFMLLRLGRLFPLHALALTGFVMLFAFGAVLSGDWTRLADNTQQADLIRTLFFVQIFANPPFSEWNAPSWSIAAEFWVYLLAAVMLATLKARTMWLLPVIIAISLGVLLPYATGLSYEFLPGLALVRCLYSFAIGMGAWYIAGSPTGPASDAGRFANIAEPTMLLLLGAAIVIFGNDRFAMVLPILFGMAVMLFARQAGWISQALQWRPFVRLGDLSYAVYILHILVIMGIGTIIPMVLSIVTPQDESSSLALHGDAFAASIVALVILIAWAAHRWVEWPLRRLSRRIIAGEGVRANERVAPTL